MDQTASDLLFRSIVQQSNDLVTVFDEQGNIVFINAAAERVLGAPAATYLGLNIVDFVHPDERERATLTLQVAREFGPAPGTTHFRIACTDGSFIALEMSAGTATDGVRRLLTITGRPSETRDGLERAMMQLVDGSTISDIMLTVCDTVSWRQMESRVGIAWTTPDAHQQWVTQGGELPPDLWGIDADADSIFALALASGIGTQSANLSSLPPQLREIAEAAGVGGYWIEPVRVGDASALIVVWTVAGGFPPTVHVQGMQLASNMVEIILRWTDHLLRLDFAANHDELTRLPNRKPFFRALNSALHGAVLYCDLDDFKPVNDRFGHAAGDALLREVADRLRSCVRGADLVARIGGDEFAILCPWSSPADAELLASRIRAAMRPPFAVDGASVRIGISIGVSYTAERLDEASVAEADRMMREAKALRQATR